jgi:hypothetical protein
MRKIYKALEREINARVALKLLKQEIVAGSGRPEVEDERKRLAGLS